MTSLPVGCIVIAVAGLSLLFARVSVTFGGGLLVAAGVLVDLDSSCPGFWSSP
jgi:hypothetical protein